MKTDVHSARHRFSRVRMCLRKTWRRRRMSCSAAKMPLDDGWVRWPSMFSFQNLMHASTTWSTLTLTDLCPPTVSIFLGRSSICCINLLSRSGSCVPIVMKVRSTARSMASSLINGSSPELRTWVRVPRFPSPKRHTQSFEKTDTSSSEYSHSPVPPNLALFETAIVSGVAMPSTCAKTSIRSFQRMVLAQPLTIWFNPLRFLRARLLMP
mmetsp:Transcript_9174/g.21641  ORF Transcript_9174/g.21641 Transcript_9174/m.21641 type:complete len:210 (-) Transcript_9174:1719-2348(-)